MRQSFPGNIMKLLMVVRAATNGLVVAQSVKEDVTVVAGGSQYVIPNLSGMGQYSNGGSYN